MNKKILTKIASGLLCWFLSWSVIANESKVITYSPQAILRQTNKIMSFFHFNFGGGRIVKINSHQSMPTFRDIVPPAPDFTNRFNEDALSNYIDSLALILPMDATGLPSVMANHFYNGCLKGLRQANAPLRVELYATNDSPQSAVNAYERALEDDIDLIVGPLRKQDVRALLKSHLVAPVPTLLLQPAVAKGYRVLTMDVEQESVELATLLYERGYQVLLVSDYSILSRRQASSFATTWGHLAGNNLLSRFYVYDKQKDWKRLFEKLKDESLRKSNQLVIVAAGNLDFVYNVRGFVPHSYPVFANSIFFDRTSSSNFLDNLWLLEMPWFLYQDEFRAFETKLVRTYSLLEQRFYALGVDACLVAQQANNWFEGWHFDGVSGQLYLQQNFFHRRGVIARYQNGQLQPAEIEQ